MINDRPRQGRATGSANERMRQALGCFDAKSRCICGHLGDGPKSEHHGLTGHKRCKHSWCDCEQFTWAHFTPAVEAVIEALGEE